MARPASDRFTLIAQCWATLRYLFWVEMPKQRKRAVESLSQLIFSWQTVDEMNIVWPCSAVGLFRCYSSFLLVISAVVFSENSIVFELVFYFYQALVNMKLDLKSMWREMENPISISPKTDSNGKKTTFSTASEINRPRSTQSSFHIRYMKFNGRRMCHSHLPVNVGTRCAMHAGFVSWKLTSDTNP